jgi:hypothetical protein
VSKYDPLKGFLAKGSGDAICLSFAQIEQIIGEPLPSSAADHRAWWANEANGPHVQARAWLDAGWHVMSVDFERASVAFGRSE